MINVPKKRALLERLNIRLNAQGGLTPAAVALPNAINPDQVLCIIAP